MKVFILIILTMILVSCVQETNTDKEEYKSIEVGSFNYSLSAYEVQFKTYNCFLLINENDLYYLLEYMGTVKNKLDYFNRRKIIIAKPIIIDSALFSNWRRDIVFVDSCNNSLVSQWIQKIKNNPTSLNKPINIDPTVKANDVNNIYYGLIKDSFEIYKEDITGKYILSK